MLEEHRLTELESGVRIVTEHMDSVRSVALGFWIGTGSSAEDVPEAGLSHLIEHMLFRGTARYGSLEIDQLFVTPVEVVGHVRDLFEELLDRVRHDPPGRPPATSTVNSCWQLGHVTAARVCPSWLMRR